MRPLPRAPWRRSLSIPLPPQNEPAGGLRVCCALRGLAVKDGRERPNPSVAEDRRWGGLGPVQGQREVELGAGPRRAVDPDPAAMQLDDLSGDREAEACADDVGAALLVSLKAAEKPLDEVRRDPDAMVAHADV